MAHSLIPAAAILADNDHMDGWDWVWGSLMMVLWLAILVAAIWFVVTRLPISRRTDRAREILEERYARGELETEEYRERLHELH